MKIYSAIAAGTTYFLLGGLWFTPLFGRAWDKAVGFKRPPKWRPALPYYVGPFVGCHLVAFAVYALLRLTESATLSHALLVGGVAGMGFSACVTAVNAISPNTPRPALYAAVVGGYHCTGTLVCASIIHWLGH